MSDFIFDYVLPGAIIAFILAAVLLVVSAFVGDSQTLDHRTHAEQAVVRLCAPRGGAIYFDVEDQNNLVYACNDDRTLHLRAY